MKRIARFVASLIEAIVAEQKSRRVESPNWAPEVIAEIIAFDNAVLRVMTHEGSARLQ